MNIEKDLDKEIEIMQAHLRELRKLAGWTAEELGGKLGITKQAVSALENGSTTMNQLHYLALVHLFESEYQENSDKEALKIVMEILFTKPEYYKEKKEDIDKKISDVATALGAGVTSVASELLIGTLLTPITVSIGVATGAATAATAITAWSKKVLNIGKKNRK